MEKVLSNLEGKKTYIVAGLMAVVFFLEKSALITPDQANMAYAILAPAGLATLRSAIGKK